MARRKSSSETAQARIERLLRDAGHVPVEPPPPTRSCDHKVQYSEKLARIVAAEQTEKAGTLIEPYPCVYCPAWHIGHPLR